MKRFILAVVALSVATFSVAQNPILKQVKSIDVSSQFAGSTGNYLGGVASDGTNIFLTGWRAGTAATTQSIIKIGTPLSTETVSTYYTQTGAESNSRITKLVAYNNSLYWNIAGGASQFQTTVFGIQKINDAAGVGVLDTAFAGDGTLTTSEARGFGLGGDNSNFRRIDSFDIDASSGELHTIGFFAGNAAAPYFHGTYRVNAGTGAYLGTKAFGGTSVSASQTNVRDISFSRTGNAYLRTDNGLAQNVAFRNNLGSSFDVSTGLFTGAAASVGGHAKVEYIESSSSSDFIVYNENGVTTASPYNLRVAKADGTLITTLNGSEDGFTNWGNTTYLSATGAVIGGKQYLIVTASFPNGTQSGTNKDQVRVYEVVPEPTSMFAMGAGLAGLIARRRRKNA